MTALKNSESLPNLQLLLQNTRSTFVSKFNSEPAVAAAGPGRVNLIGEHVDYNDGFVLPMTLSLFTVVVGKANPGSTTCSIYSMAIKKEADALVKIDLSQPISRGEPDWANYVRGVIALFKGRLCGFEAVLNSDVPLGGGLSSSASLEVTFYTFLEQIALLAEPVLPKEKAQICQQAEHKFAGMPCGMMDQMIITCGKADHAMLLDCRTLNFDLLPFADPKVVVLVTNTNVKHELTGSEYSERREMCHEAAAKFGKPSLRDVSLQEFEVNEPKISSVMYRRVKHVIAEIQRTKEAADALAARNYEKFGQLMKWSHASLRDNFEVSCPELDQCVDIANAQPGVYGSRMTGGGFGGCTVTLVKKEAVQQLMEAIKANYRGKPTFTVCTAVDGAKPVPI